MHVIVGLALRDQAGAYSLLVSQATPGDPAYRHFLTPEQFTASYAATADSAATVMQYLVSLGFTVTMPSNRLYIEATGTAASVQHAFNTTLSTFTFNGRTVFANTSEAQVPAALAGIVTGVVGLQNAYGMHTFLGNTGGAKGMAAKATLVPPVTLTPGEFQTYYDAAGVPEASNTTIAIFTAGDMSQDLKDIAQFRTEQKLAPLNSIIVKHTGILSPDQSGDGEWDMDIATSTGLAGNVKQLILYATTSLNDADLIPNFNHFVTDNIATIGNASFGGCTATEMTSGALLVYDPIFEQSSAQGQTVFASAGDVGSSCPVVGVANGVPGAGLPDQSFPASSPYVMGVGGTTLTVNSDYSYGMEISWNAGGGGMEPLEFSPFWQQPVLPTGALTTASPIGSPVSVRGVPDVAMDADFLLSPAAYVLTGADTSNGGTSLASPLMTGCYARLQSLANNSLGHAGPLFYKAFITAGLPTATVKAMHDITVGANGMYTALPGYDYNTGIGTCDIAAMAKLVPAASGTTTGSTTGSTTGGTTGGTTGSTTGGTTGGTTGSTTGGTTGGTTGTTTGSTTGGTTGGTTGTTTGSTTGGGLIAPTSSSTSGDSRLGGGGGAMPLTLLGLAVAAVRRRRRGLRG